MSQPEDRDPQADGEMGAGHEAYGHLSETGDEATRFRVLAEAARSGGEPELADRFDAYATDVERDGELAKMVRRTTTDAKNAVQALARKDSGRASITSAFPGGRVSEAVLAAIRETVITHGGLKSAAIHRIETDEGPAVRYVVPLDGGTRYVETYYEDHGMTNVEIEK